MLKTARCGSLGVGARRLSLKESALKIAVTGSLAYDYIMSFPGYFKDHILPDKVHMLTVSFLVEKVPAISLS